ncbi:DUF1570 domain-containing protein [Anaerohalosphaera lusitana]|nr:DUF1570 domain-containing protein [Anaerohalosphaera lusitana]
MASLLELLNSQFRDLFKKKGFELRKPSEELTWVSFEDLEDFENYAQKIDRVNLGGIKGYYSSRTNRVAVVKSSFDTSEIAKEDGDRFGSENSSIMAMAAEGDESLTKIQHEAAHQLAFNSGLQKRHVMYPLWYSEGLATYLENGYYNKDNEIRRKRLVELFKEGRLRRLDEFVTEVGVKGDNDEAKDLYAQAWGFFKFMMERKPELLKAYTARLYETEPGWRSEFSLYQELAQSAGSFEKLNAEWLDFVQELTSHK